MLSIFRMAVFILLLTAFVLPGAVAQNQIIELWPDGAPGAISNPAYIEGLASDKPNRILRVSNPTLTIYLPDRSENTGTACTDPSGWRLPASGHGYRGI